VRTRASRPPTRPRPRLSRPKRALAAAAVTVAAALAGGPAPAAAVPTTCPPAAAAAGTVTITEPGPGATVGGPVTVKGTAGAPDGVQRVELFVGEALKDFQAFDPPRTGVDLALRWDAAEAPAGPAKLTVVVCGGNPGRVVQAATVDLTVAAPASPPPTPARLAVAREQDRPSTGPPWVAAAFAAGGIAALLAVTSSARRRRPVPPAG
jgi:hypothetical protein